MNDLPALLITNEKSRRGGEVGPFIEALERGGMQIRRELCHGQDEICPLISELREQVGCVILGGGDGTMHAAAPALRDTALPLGILPLGTANDLARTLDIPDDAEQAAGVILRGQIREVDLGIVNERLFFNIASVGLSVAVTKRLNGATKRRYGALAYPLAAAAALIRAGRFRAILRADGEEHVVTTFQIAVGNGKFYGGGMAVDAEAAIDDGLLDGYSLEPKARWRLLLMARAFRAGEHERLPTVRSFRCRTVTVSTRRPRDVSADGEIVTRTPANFAVLPRAVRVFVP